MRYIEANPLRAGLVETAADWKWSSFAHRHETRNAKPFKPDAGPVLLPKNWHELVNEPFEEKESVELANCIKRGCPYGERDWIAKTAEQLNLQSTLRKKGRPRKYPDGI